MSEKMKRDLSHFYGQLSRATLKRFRAEYVAQNARLTEGIEANNRRIAIIDALLHFDPPVPAQQPTDRPVAVSRHGRCSVCHLSKELAAGICFDCFTNRMKTRPKL